MRNFIDTADRWYKKACATEDSFDQFVSMWISFNAIYGAEQEDREIRKIQNVIQRLNPRLQERIINQAEVGFFCTLDSPIKYQHYDTQRRISEIRSTEGEQRKLASNRSSNPEIALKNLVTILNRVRNNLFHGSKLIHHSRDRDIVKNAYPIIRALVEGYFEQNEFPLSTDGNAELTDGNVTVSQYPEITATLSQILDQNRALSQDINIVLNQLNAPKRNGHPIGILLEFDLIGRVLFEALPPTELHNARQKALNMYENSKSEEQKDITEVYNWVNNVIGQNLANELSRETIQTLNNQYKSLCNKMREKGYYIH